MRRSSRSRDDLTPLRRPYPDMPCDLRSLALCPSTGRALRVAGKDDPAPAGEPIAPARRRPSRVGRWVRGRRKWRTWPAGGAGGRAQPGSAFTWPRPDAGPGPVDMPAALPSDLALVPEGAFGFITVRAADLWALPEPHDLVKEIGTRSDPPVTLDSIGTSLRRSYGVHPRDMERVTFVFRATGNSADIWFTVLAMTGDHSPDRLRQALDVEGRYATEGRGGGTLYVTKDWGGMAVCPYDDRVVLIGDPNAVREVATGRPRMPWRPAGHGPAPVGRGSCAGRRPPTGADFLSEVFRLAGPAQDAAGRATTAGLVTDIPGWGAMATGVLEGWLEYAGREQAAAAIGPVRRIRASSRHPRTRLGASRPGARPSPARFGAPWRQDATRFGPRLPSIVPQRC